MTQQIHINIFTCWFLIKRTITVKRKKALFLCFIRIYWILQCTPLTAQSRIMP